MPLSDFTDTYSWREAVELGPVLVQLAEQLPASEELGLSFRLRKAMVDLPASIAYDLLEGDSYTRKLHIARITAMLEIIDRVYPALDTGSVRTKLEKLAARVASSNSFGEITPGAKKVFLPGAEVPAGPDGPMPKPPTPTPPKPSPASVQVVPDEQPAHHDHDHEGHEHDGHEHHGDDNHEHHDHDEPAAPALKVPVSPDGPASPSTDAQEDHVHSDRSQ